MKTKHTIVYIILSLPLICYISCSSILDTKPVPPQEVKINWSKTVALELKEGEKLVTEFEADSDGFLHIIIDAGTNGVTDSIYRPDGSLYKRVPVTYQVTTNQFVTGVMLTNKIFTNQP